MQWLKFQLPLIRTSRLIIYLPLLAGMSLISFAQQAEQVNQLAPLPLPAREAVARPLLLHAESASVALDPNSRCLLLYRTAGAWLPLEPSHAVQLYRESFASARESNPALRQYFEDLILNDLLPLSPSDVLDLLPNAETATRTRLYTALINFLLFQGDYPAAARAFERAVATGIQPRKGTIHVLASLPDSASAERIRIFAAAVHFYQAHPNPEGFKWTLADLVARFYPQLPPVLVLQAIDTVLEGAERQEDQRPGGGIRMSFRDNSINFNSNYEFQLFAVAPALQHLDPPRAANLLARHPEVISDLKRYPQGLASLDELGYMPNRSIITPDHHKPIGLQLFNTAEFGQNLSPMDMGLEFTIPRNLNILGVTGSVVYFPNPNDPEASILDRTGTCPTDVPHRLDLARTVPILRKVPTFCSGPFAAGCSYSDTFPRAYLIKVIAERCTYYLDPAAARAALHDELETLTQMPEEAQVEFLATAADLYLRLGDREAATGVIGRGFNAASTIRGHELSSEKLHNVPIGIWASAEAYRRMITLGVNASLDVTRKLTDEIPDSNLRELEQVMLARALLGVPVRRYMVANASGGFGVGDVEVTYDQF